jgi:hypothetical protein
MKRSNATPRSLLAGALAHSLKRRAAKAGRVQTLSLSQRKKVTVNPLPISCLQGSAVGSANYKARRKRLLARTAPESKPLPASAPVPLRFRTCQFIAGDPRRDASKCGVAVQHGSVYCAAHHSRCRAPMPAVAPGVPAQGL